ncbi:MULTISPECIES: IPExxxVDY family protein [unclassified Polaribacter]|uniref:IPExxxVDY family protein n=1 Tax=unclassified Polaribacter TaxID=196858 RepID=UPI0011BE28DB|nr:MULTISPECIES: IPExxxVDY family protein [unclassified Polaribacter]TXD53550.1 IPExxxVDY family protein [Polaribacter sp. IC063]TXD58622.1 IPExxxVDY family protein [Polaribacter sp. IC066]
MQIHSLGLDVLCEEEYSLIGIHTTLEDYKLAYLLNKNLGTLFCKSKEDLSFEKMPETTSFSLFNYSNENYDFEWFLLANSSKRENQTAVSQLQLISETKTYLIPEKKKVDFFIKISGNVPYSLVVETVNKIKTIDQVITSYSIDKDTLKSKDFLIF